MLLNSLRLPLTAINAAIDALVMVTNVTGVSATDAKTLTVTFNTAISAADQATATFAVKRGTTPTTVLAPVWAADGKSVELARSTNFIAGTYTVTVGGFALGTSTATTDVVAQKMAKLEITTSNIIVSSTAKVNFIVSDQYGTELTKAANTFNWTVVNITDASRTVKFGDLTKNGYAVLNTAADANAPATVGANVGDVLRVTGLLTSDPTVTVTKDITVSNIYTNTFAFGEVVLPDGAERLMQNVGYVELGYTAADNLGADLIFTDRAAGASNEFNNIQFFTSDADVIPVTGANGFKVEDGKLKVKVLNDSGDVTITALNVNTGATTTKKITVNATAVPTTVEFGEFKDQEIISGDPNGTAQLGVTFFDQYGVAIVNDTYNMTTNFNITVTGAGATPLAVTSSLNGGYMVFNDSAVTPGTYTVTLINKTTGVSNAVQLVANEARVPNQLEVVTAPDASVEPGTSTAVVFNVLDQYGDDVAYADLGAFTIVPTTTDGVNRIQAINVTSYTVTLTGAVAAATPITETVTFTLEDASNVAIDNQAFDIEVIAKIDALEVTADKTEYVAGQNATLTIKGLKAGVVHTGYNKTGVASITDGTNTFLRTVTFVNGVATTTVPVNKAGAAITATVTFDGQSDATPAFKVVAAAANKLAIGALDVLSVVDAFGNPVEDYDFTGIATVTNVNGNVNLVLDTENQVQIKIIDGDVFRTDGTTAVTFTEVDNTKDATLTLALSNGLSLTATIPAV